MARTMKLPLEEGTTVERLRAAEISRALVLFRPWALMLGSWILLAVLHGFFGQWWEAALTGALGAGLAVWTWHIIPRQHGQTARWHAVATIGLLGLWAGAADFWGPFHGKLAFATVLGGIAGCLTWNIRAHARTEHESTQLERVFKDKAAPTVGLTGATMRVTEAGPRVIRAEVITPKGEFVAEDIVKRAPYLDAAYGWPRGTFLAAPDPDHAHKALTTITDPRRMRQPIPWEGPSAPGKSIAEPICVGPFQDGELSRWVIIGHHAQVMGMTGAGKTEGGGWSFIAEVVTRYDAAVFAADITKEMQELGPLLPALHRLETTKDGARQLLEQMDVARRKRTEYLASKGLGKWQKGCGLTYIVLWLEECPEILDGLGDARLEKFVMFVKAARSAGIFIGFSLQRSDWSQLPTIVRGQLAKWCFGVADGADAGFGLSGKQQALNAEPEMWGAAQPGMSYLHAPSIPEERVAMPLRTWYWGEDDSLIRRHAEAYPVTKRPLDPVTAQAMSEGATMTQPPRPGESDQPEDVIREYLGNDGEEEGDDELRHVSIDDPIEYDEDFGALEFTSPEERPAADPAVARQKFREHVTAIHAEGQATVTGADFIDLRHEVGMSRSWVYKMLGVLEDEGVLERLDEAVATWRVIRP